MNTLDDLRKQAADHRRAAMSDDGYRNLKQREADEWAKLRDDRLAKAEGIEAAIAVLEAAAEYQP